MGLPRSGEFDDYGQPVSTCTQTYSPGTFGSGCSSYWHQHTAPPGPVQRWNTTWIEPDVPPADASIAALMFSFSLARIASVIPERSAPKLIVMMGTGSPIGALPPPDGQPRSTCTHMYWPRWFGSGCRPDLHPPRPALRSARTDASLKDDLDRGRRAADPRIDGGADLLLQLVAHPRGHPREALP